MTNDTSTTDAAEATGAAAAGTAGAGTTGSGAPAKNTAAAMMLRHAFGPAAAPIGAAQIREIRGSIAELRGRSRPDDERLQSRLFEVVRDPVRGLMLGALSADEVEQAVRAAHAAGAAMPALRYFTADGRLVEVEVGAPLRQESSSVRELVAAGVRVGSVTVEQP